MNSQHFLIVDVRVMAVEPPSAAVAAGTNSSGTAAGRTVGKCLSPAAVITMEPLERWGSILLFPRHC